MNRLSDETSPYLRQHRDNPVDWHPWGHEAFELARERDRPILLSVGYSSCHWCHVMAHESFEDPAVAEVMNRLFVNVKVDREERPDVDAIYMQAVQAMTGRGGWPMTVFLTPDGLPFFGGTYFPTESFLRLLEAVDDAWGERRADLAGDAERLAQVIRQSNELQPSRELLSRDLLQRGHEMARHQFDSEWGGFGRAPKFPQAMTIEFLLRSHHHNPSTETLEMVRTTLDAMASGGLYDQVGGGFHRYSVDAFWLVPHFEKMLYDQATIIRAYLDAYLITSEPRYRAIVEESIEYVLRDLRHPLGGFFSAEDADSEGEEGTFYVWRVDEVEDLCGEDAPEVIRYYGMTKGGNFEGANILHVAQRGEPRNESVERARAKLFAARTLRIRPGLDDKVLLGWNAMFCDALARAAAAFQRSDWMDAARINARFLLAEMRREDGRLLRSWQDGRARHVAYSEDYAALLEALVTLAEVDDVAWLSECRGVADDLIRLFHDAGPGGFFTTGSDAEELITRPKDLFDNAIPSANSLAAQSLLRFAALTGDKSYEEPAVSAIRLVRDAMAEHPTAFSYIMGAVERYLTPSVEIAIIGDPDDPQTEALRRVVFERFLPNAVVACSRPENGADMTPLLADRTMIDGRPTAYVCEHFTCKLPATSPEILSEQLSQVIG